MWQKRGAIFILDKTVTSMAGLQVQTFKLGPCPQIPELSSEFQPSCVVKPLHMGYFHFYQYFAFSLKWRKTRYYSRRGKTPSSCSHVTCIQYYKGNIFHLNKLGIYINSIQIHNYNHCILVQIGVILHILPELFLKMKPHGTIDALRIGQKQHVMPSFPVSGLMYRISAESLLLQKQVAVGHPVL